MMKVMITGANGQSGWELQNTAPSRVRIFALNSSQLDIRNRDAVNDAITSIRPDVLINAAAYTAVDRAEQEPEAAFAVNAHGAANLAAAVAVVKARLIHISTDFVFDGRNSSPYLPEDTPNPLGVYGASKLEGEQRVSDILGEKALIVRTSWVYSAHGNNFVKTMLRLMADRDSLGVVADQIGTPTWANELARAIWLAVEKNLSGIHHWTDSGVAGWYDFAVAIQEEARTLGILKKDVAVKPIRTRDYPTPAQRPSFSVLDKTGMCEALGYFPPHWRVNLRKMLLELRTED